MASAIQHDVSLLTEHDIYLFKEGTHFHLDEKLGAHLFNRDGVDGVLFAVWAPNARQVSVIGEFNGWEGAAHPLRLREDGSGIWEGFVPGLGRGSVYPDTFLRACSAGSHQRAPDPSIVPLPVMATSVSLFPVRKCVNGPFDRPARMSSQLTSAGR